MSDIDWGGKPVPVTRLCGWDWVPLDIAQARIAALEAALTAERERADRADLDAAICRDAIETAWRVVNDLPAESDSDAAVRRCALRKLGEAVGKAEPRLMFEQPEGQNLYGLNYRHWIERAKAAEAERDALRERADRAERDCNGLSLDVQTLKAERDALRERVARLVGVIEAAPHGAGCLFGLKATASMFYHCNCWKRTALGDK